ncbi:MAG: hypothetical protein K6E27_00825 [Eubacterium sp.]|nr:hypothetical protein [Eubacterium sp.]
MDYYNNDNNNYGNNYNNNYSNNYNPYDNSQNTYGNITYSRRNGDAKKKIVFWIMFLGFWVLIIAMFIGGRKQARERELELAEQEKKVMEELEKDTFRTEDEIYGRLIESMESGETDNVYMRVPGTFSKDDLMDIAHKVDPMMGRVYQMSYSVSTTHGGNGSDEVADYYIGVNYHYEICDEYYVTEKILSGKEIPQGKDKAKKLCTVCEKFLNEYITPGMTDYDKELAAHDYIVNNCEYSFSDANDMTEYYAYGALVNGKAVCSGYSRATALLLNLCDIDVKLISGDANNDNAADSTNPDGTGSTEAIIAPDGSVVEGHMWNQVKIDGIWYNLDTTWDDPYGTDVQELRHTYFNVDDTILKKNHEWDSKDAEKCSSTFQNYYEKNGIYFKSNDDYLNYVKDYLAAGNRDELECAVAYPNTSEDALSFIFTYDGITCYQVGTRGVDGYEIITLYFNPEQ